MTHSIDTSFRDKRQARVAERRRSFFIKLGLALALLAIVGGGLGYYLTSDQWSFGEDLDEQLVAADENEDLPADAAVYVPAIVDLAGDPMWLTQAREAGAESRVRTRARPAELEQFNISSQINVLSDTMLSSSERFMTTIPSSQEDFAFFQAQKTVLPGSLPDVGDQDLQPMPEGDELEPAAELIEGAGDMQAESDPAIEAADEAAAGWGETVDEGTAALPAFEKTAIENNTSLAITTPEAERFQATDDIFVKILNNRTLDSVVLEGRFSEQDAKLAGEALKALYSKDGLATGDVVALRGFRPRRDATAHALMQVSIYTKDVYIGTLSRNAAGLFVTGVDPWVQEDLFNYSGQPDQGGHKRQYRLLDAIYSTAARNNVPTGVIGEAIMYLSRGQDLNAFATYKDRFVLVYSETARGKDGASGRVLYAGVVRDEGSLECFVFQQGDGEFACVTGDDQVRSITTNNGMVTPVNGVLTSTFGPRRHPILKTVRIHKGVDWAGPTGTPIMAAFDGVVSFAGDGGGYGNLVKLTHPDGRETRYAHQSRFAPTTIVGQQVKAGDVIGYVGTTGLSTGPHLHFEMYFAGQAIDPLAPAAPVVAAVVVTAEESASDAAAVEILVDRIIRVESGGNARAKNPLSSATGLGQFIDSTWIRMMNTYRPDLAGSLSRSDLLALRFDPTISREMVKALAREGEAYLKARGHGITAGRLYLCHFLGMQGAAIAIAASPDAMVGDVMGASVVRANPFLTGKNIAYLQQWAENKMRQRGSRVTITNAPSTPATTTREVRETSPEFEKYKSTMTGIVQATANAI